MNLSELRDLVRQRTRDTIKPYFVTDEEIDTNLNEAEREACRRALLLEDFDSFTIELNTTDTRYELDPRVIDVISITIGTDTPRDFTESWTLTETHLILDRIPATVDTLTLRCYRLPMEGMASDIDEPEIRSMYHSQMADWAIALSYLTPDAELFNPDAAARYESRFTQSFGERPSALTRRNQRSKHARRVTYNGAI